MSTLIARTWHCPAARHPRCLARAFDLHSHTYASTFVPKCRAQSSSCWISTRSSSRRSSLIFQSVHETKSLQQTFRTQRLLSAKPLIRRTQRFARPASQSIRRASSSSKPGPADHRKVTVLSDDGHVRWADLSRREKAARATQQSFNFGIVILGTVMTSGVIYLLYTQVFSTDSPTVHFNKAVDEIRASPRVRLVLCGDEFHPHQISAYGEPSWNKWRRNRPIASSVRSIGSTAEELQMHFYVEGPKAKGEVRLLMTRPDRQHAFEYQRLSVDVPGHATIWLHNTQLQNRERKGGFRFLGVEWT